MIVWRGFRTFEEIVIVKPFTSRPANSERYILCKGKRTPTLSPLSCPPPQTPEGECMLAFSQCLCVEMLFSSCVTNGAIFRGDRLV